MIHFQRAFGIISLLQATFVAASFFVVRQESSFSSRALIDLGNPHSGHFKRNSPIFAEDPLGTKEGDPSEVIAKRIVVTGDVQGGYYRACVKNEVRGENSKLRHMLASSQIVLPRCFNVFT